MNPTAMKSTLYIILALAATAPAAAAQDLSTEVVVDRTAEPAERAATRPEGIFPQLVLPQVALPSLKTAEYSGFGAVTRTYDPLSPAAEPGLPEPSPYRGYASVGYFPLYNLGVSAGYRIIHTSRTRLGVWGQFDGESFKAPDDAWRQMCNGGRLGLDLNQAVGRNSHLLASLSGGYGGFKSAIFGTQKASGGSLKARWISQAGPVLYTAAVRADLDFYSDFDYRGPQPLHLAGADQKVLGFDIGGAYAIDSLSRAGLEVKGRWLLTTNFHSNGAVTFTPYVTRRSRTYAARLGVDLDIVAGPTSGFKAAPRVDLAWTPSGVAAVYLSATGGSRINSTASLRQYTPYMVGAGTFCPTHVPVDARLGFNFGPFDGFSAEIFGAYALADHLVMPAPLADGLMAPADVKAFRFFARAAYRYADLFQVSASASFAQHKGDKAWYEWLDRASQVYTADAEIYPLKQLTVSLGYEFRCGRHAAGLTEDFGLGCVSDLRAGANYNVTPALSVFALAENILGRRYLLLPGVVSAPVHGLVGIDFKF